MLKAITIRLSGALPLVLGLSLGDFAADHGDLTEAAARGEPSSDVADVYAWISNDTTRLNMVLTVHPDAARDAWFSTEVVYAVAVSSSPALGEPQAVTTISCQFVDTASIECWAGDDYVLGDPRDPSGIFSDEGHLRVFAGLRDDPFFLEAGGFDAALDTLAAGMEGGAFDVVNGCPRLDEAQRAEVRGLLVSGENGADASNSFAGQDVLALVLQVDKAVLATNGPILGVWASTYSSAAR